MNRKKLDSALMLCVVAFLLAVPAFAVDEQLAQRYMNAANDQYSLGNYAKAYSYVNTVMDLYGNDPLPQNVEVLAETAYYSNLLRIKEGRLYAELDELREKVAQRPFLATERIARTINVIESLEARDSRGPSGAGASRAVGATADELRLALESVRKETAAQNQRVNDEFRSELLGTQRDAYETALREAKEANGATGRVLVLILTLVAGICFIIFIAVIVNLSVSVRGQKAQNEKFVETLKVVSELARLPGQTSVMQALPHVYGPAGEVRMIGSALAETGLPPEPATEAERAELSALAVKCRDFGAQIDQATGRKNNSKNVAELVFKISQEMGWPQYESTLFFSVAMVYDIGFLSIDKGLLLSENLTEDQKYEIRNHVKQGLAQLSFVPERYMSVFADGVLMHHENMDGSGYPEGLTGSRIPYVARMIRVAESFNALISKRNYREIVDKESAVGELKKSPGLYDPELVDILERLI